MKGDVMNYKKIIIALLIRLIAVNITGFVFLYQSNNSNNNNTTNSTNITSNNTSNLNNTSATSDDTPANVEKVNSKNTQKSNAEEKQTDYNSPDSEYFKSDADGSYHKKEPGMNYVYEQDAITGEWSYWADKS